MKRYGLFWQSEKSLFVGQWGFAIRRWHWTLPLDVCYRKEKGGMHFSCGFLCFILWYLKAKRES